MTRKLSLGAKIAFGVLSLSMLSQLGGFAADASNESRPLRRWLANRQQRADEAANAQKAGDDAATRSWRQDPRYQYRGVFENRDALPNDSYGGRPSMYRVPPPEAYQKMYGPPAGYPQTQARGLGSRLLSSKNAGGNDSTAQSTAPTARPWAQRTPEPIPLEAITRNPSPAPLPVPPPPAPLPQERNVKRLPDANTAPAASTLSQPKAVAKLIADSPKREAYPSTPYSVGAKAADSRPKAVEKAPSAPAKASASGLMSLQEFDFPDPPAKR